MPFSGYDRFLHLVRTDPHGRNHRDAKQQRARLPCQIYHISMHPISSEDASGAHWHLNGGHWYLIDCRCQRRWHHSRSSHSAHQITATFVPRRHCCSLRSWLLCGMHAEVPFLSFASLTFVIECCEKRSSSRVASIFKNALCYMTHRYLWILTRMKWTFSSSCL